jgi:hypothetical protein
MIASRLRGNSPGAQLYYATSWVLGGIGGLVAGTGTAIFASSPGLGDAVLLGVFVTLSLPWIMGPLLEPTLADGTVDPRRLEQFPLTTWQQVGGLLLGALIAPTATFTMLFASGPVVALVGEALPGRLAAFSVALVYTVMCVATSRSAQALLAESLRSRRGRDIAALGAAVLVLVVYALAMHVRGTIESLSAQMTGPVGEISGWLPPGAGARAIIAARDGDWSDFGVRMAVMLAMTAVAILVWAWSLGRRVRGDISSQGAGYRRSVSDPLPLVPRALAWLPAGEATAASAQQLRYFFFRSPKAIQTLLIPPVMGMMVAHSTFGSFGSTAQAAAFAALAVVVGSFNVFGYDGPGFRYLVLSATSLSKVLWGKVLAPLVYLFPLLAAYVVVEALLGGDLAGAPVAFCAGAAVFALGIGIGAQSSILNPNDQSRIGHRQGMFLKVFGWFMGFFVVASVGAGVWVVLARWFGDRPAAVVMLAVAILLAMILVSTAGRRLDRDPSVVLAKLQPEGF